MEKGDNMAKSTKLEYLEYKSLETALAPGQYNEVKETTVDGMAYRKTIILILGEREFRFVGPWKHEFDCEHTYDPRIAEGDPGRLESA